MASVAFIMEKLTGVNVSYDVVQQLLRERGKLFSVLDFRFGARAHEACDAPVRI